MTIYKTIEDARRARDIHPRRDSIVACAQIAGGYILLCAPYSRLAANPPAGVTVIGMAVDFAAEREAQMEANVPGLQALRDAISRREIAWQNDRRMMEDEMGDGAAAVAPTPDDVPRLRAQYPRAAAYLAAEEWALSTWLPKYNAGRAAMEAIREGADHEDAMRRMHAATKNIG